jgi:ubiquinone/menaquinone biosynthesis C-methylase UbiE
MMKETVIDKWFRKMRLQRVIPYLTKDTVLVDIGCGYDAQLLLALKNEIKKGIGIDQKLEAVTTGNIDLKKITIENKLPIDDGIADVITMLAVLEHVKYPELILKEAYRILKPDGLMIITTPTPRSRFALELLAFKMGIIDSREILDHKRYLWGYEIYNMLLEAGFSSAEWKEFQFGMNTFVKAVK